MSTPRIGDRVRACRLARGWTQEDLVTRLGRRGVDMHVSTLSRIETGEIQSFTERQLDAFERVFGISNIRRDDPDETEARP